MVLVDAGIGVVRFRFTTPVNAAVLIIAADFLADPAAAGQRPATAVLQVSGNAVQVEVDPNVAVAANLFVVNAGAVINGAGVGNVMAMLPPTPFLSGG
ncbi:MAG: hypothetical protein ACRD0K_23505 [Egibacteraceae bacterium]